MLRRNEVEIRPGKVRIGHDRVGLVQRAVGQPHARRLAVLDHDLLHLGVEMYAPPELLEETGKALNNLAGSAHGIVHAPLALQIVDERIDGRSVERIAPNQKRVKEKQRRRKSSFTYCET